MKYAPWQHKSLRTILLAATPMFFMGVPALAQSTQTQATQSQSSATESNVNPGGPMQGTRPDQDDGYPQDASLRQQLAQFGRFLDSNPTIAQQLQKNPSLADNQNFINSNPAYKQFLQRNPDIRVRLHNDPTAFMREETRYESWENSHNGDGNNNRGEAFRRDVAEFDRFLNDHPEIAEQLRKQPSLIDNRQFVTSHPPLDNFLHENPGVWDAIRNDPRGFMDAAEHFDQRDYARNGDVNGQARNDNNDNGDRNYDRDRADFRRFCDDHPEIGEQVRRNPALVNDRQFVESHPELRTYVQNHPQLQNEIRQDQYAFLQREDNDRNFNGADRNGNNYDRDNGVNRDHAADFGRFLGNHENIARDCEQNPAVLRDEDYLRDHPELKAYLQANPQIAADLRSDPGTFIKAAQELNNYNGSGATGKGTTGDSTTTGTTSTHSGSTSGNGSTDTNKTTK